MTSQRCWFSIIVALAMAGAFQRQNAGFAGAYVPLSSNTLALFPYCFQGCTCDDFYQLVRCEGLNLVAIPSVRNNTRVIYFQGNAISSLTRHSLRRFRQLRLLDLGDNRIMAISEDAFQNQPRLLKLSLSGNNLTTVPIAALSKLRSVRALDLTGNRISSLSPESFVNLTKLQNLSLSFNQLHVISGDAFVRMDSLRILSLDFNYLDEMPQGLLRDCNRLEHIYLSNNNIGTFVNNSEILGQFSARDWFDAAAPARLKTLSLHHNVIDILSPSCFREMTGLTSLDISGNYIRELQDDLFGNLVTLETLKLGDNPLYVLPPNLLHNMSMLVIFEVPNCQLTEIPRDLFSNLTQLQTIDLTNNAISNAEFILRVPQLSLRYLYLGQNSITEFPEDSLSAFLSLEVLNLSDNLLTEVPNIKGLGFLETLDISINRVESLGSHVFNGTALVSLDFSQNDVKTIAQSTFDDIPRLENLKLHLNPWVCECHLKWILQIERYFNSRMFEEISCSWPKGWEDENLMYMANYDANALPSCTTYAKRQSICKLIAAWLAVVAVATLVFWAVTFHRARRRFRTRRPRKRSLLFRNPNETNAGSTCTTGHSNVRFKALDSETESLDDDETTV